MVDRPTRLRAAELVRQFRDQQTTNDQFEDSYYPLMRSTGDRALKAIATALWTLYSDGSESLLANRAEYPAEVRQMLDRCIEFLQSTDEYRWERDNFIGIAGLTTLWRKGRLTARRLLGRRLPAGLHVGPDSESDWQCWPYLPPTAAD
jgi:hypothetical protein